VNDLAIIPAQDVGELEMRVIAAAPRYLITSDGRIWSTITNRFMKHAQRRDGYFYTSLRESGRYVQSAVHRLVATAWIRHPLPGEWVNHKNLVKTDNRVENLEWTTPLENNLHAWRELPPETIAWMRKRRSDGARTMNRKKRLLSCEQIGRIRALLSAGASHARIAPGFGVSASTIRNIAIGRIYVD